MSDHLAPVAALPIGEIANQYAARDVFVVYQEKAADQTLRRQRADLALFQQYLAEAGLSLESGLLFADPLPWSHITFGLVAGFVRWQFKKGYAIGSINVRLSSVKQYAGLATKAGALSMEAYGLIRLVEGYSVAQGQHADEKRETTRVGEKKAEPIIISWEQAEQLKNQPDTPQGRRDCLLMCLLLDHGLRCGEVASLMLDCLERETGTFSFYRKKVGLTQRHEMSADTSLALARYLEVASPERSLLMGSRKGGALTGRMSERAITARVCTLCERIGVEGASAHDGRHAWATFAVRGGTDIKSLQDGGGWRSPAMPLRYIASQKIANRGVKLAK